MKPYFWFFVAAYLILLLMLVVMVVNYSGQAAVCSEWCRSQVHDAIGRCSLGLENISISFS